MNTAAESTFSPVTPQCNLNERYFYQNRKISSPMSSYYESSHKAISEFLDKKLYDYSKSNNYIEKSSVTPKGNIYYGYIPMMQSRMIDLYDKKELNNKEEQIEKKMNTPLKLSSKMNISFFVKIIIIKEILIKSINHLWKEKVIGYVRNAKI